MYFFIKLVFIEPVVSSSFFIMMFDSMVFYAVLWDYAFIIPDAILDFRQQLAIKATTGGQNSKYFRRRARSLRCVGVHVGSFMNIERTCTLVFMDFVSNSVVSLLLTF